MVLHVMGYLLYSLPSPFKTAYFALKSVYAPLPSLSLKRVIPFL